MMKPIKISALLLLTLSNSFFIVRAEPGQQIRSTNSIENIKLFIGQNECRPIIEHPFNSTRNLSPMHSRNRRTGQLDLRVGRDMYTDDQMESIYNLINDFSRLRGKLTIDELNLALLSTRSHSLAYDDMLMHRYDTFSMLKQSFGPHIDQELCLKQLEHLNTRVHRLEKQRFKSTDLNLHQLLDTYGRVSSGLTAANLVWPGMYSDCLSLKIESTEGETPTRYCLAAIKHKSWPKDNQLSKIMAFKAGVCLPRACDSLRHKNKYELIERLMDFNAREVEKGQTYLDNLYCLPDDDSPMQMWWKSPRTLQAVIVFAAWIAILIYATIKYEILSKPALVDKNGGSNENLANLSLATGLRLGSKRKGNFDEIYRMIAITNNLKSLFDARSETIEKYRNDGSTASEEFEPKFGQLKQVVDLRCLEGIKVICMSYVIMGHVLMCMTSITSNGRELASASSPTFIVANLMPAFAVNAFFAITGLLTCYLLFKQNEKYSLLTSPLKWATLVVYRYLRIMPIYVVVIYYCKYISKFTGSGPSWDYGTSSLAARHRCEEENWLWTILFGANFKPVFDQCIPSTWYLANDFQFFMVTPIFLITLHKSPLFGQRLLKFCMAAGYFAGIISMLSSCATDPRPIASFMPHGFKTYVTFFSASYTRPYYRIPAYLCGLLLGYQLHVYEQDKLKYRREAAARKGCSSQGPKEPDWPEWFLKRGAHISLLSILLCAIIPIIGAKLPLNKFFANFLAALVMSSYHIMFALGVGLYILLATTGHGNKFLNHCLSASFWKPLARLNLCVVLINIEVVNYIVQSSKQLVYADFFTHSSLNLLGITVTYLTAIVVFVLFEAPIKAVLNQLVSWIIDNSLRIAETKCKEQ